MLTKAMDMDAGECFRWHNDVYRVSDTACDSSEQIKVVRIMTFWPHEKVWKWVNPKNAHEEDFNPMCNVDPMSNSVDDYLTQAIATFAKDPADTPFQDGYLAALKEVKKELIS